MNTILRDEEHTPAEPEIGRTTHTSAHWVAVGLTAIVGAIQFSLAWTDGPILFVLPAAILLASVVGALAGTDRRLLYALGVPFVIAQLFAALMQGLPTRELGVLAITLEVALLGFFVYLLRSERTTERTEGLRSTGDGYGSSHRTHCQGNQR